MKDEVIDVDAEKTTRDKKKSQSLGQALAEAASSHSRSSKPSRRKKRSRSRSKSKRSKKRRRKSSSRSSSARSSKDSDSSEDSLMPPLKRKSQRTPGAVFKMLEEHMCERLSHDADIGTSFLDEDGQDSQRPKFQTYYQLCLKPALDPRSRDAKELSLLSRGLDLLRSGKLEHVADVMSARLIAVDTATRQGWQTARFLEIDPDAEDGCAPAHVLLAAQRHGRLVEKAGGKGSWSRASSWTQQEWTQDARPKGKGKDPKGKGKKGRGKGKGFKGSWQYWGGEDRPKGSDATPKKDGEK